MAKKKTVAKNAAKKKATKRLSEVMKPSGMTLEEWQVALRQQAAMSEISALSLSTRSYHQANIGCATHALTGDTRWCIVEQIVCGTIAHALISKIRN